MCTIIMLSIIQGLYIMRKDGEKEIEHERQQERREVRERQLVAQRVRAEQLRQEQFREEQHRREQQSSKPREETLEEKIERQAREDLALRNR